jgi:general stress protein 26
VSELSEIAPKFLAMAHQIVWCVAATSGPSGEPTSRVLHPVWEWDGEAFTGWIATSPESLKAKHLAARPQMSVTYWAANHDTCTAGCDVEWETSTEARQAGWNRFANASAPVGYDPSTVPGWTSPEAESFGVIRPTPKRMSLMEGSVMMRGEGALMSWHR